MVLCPHIELLNAQDFGALDGEICVGLPRGWVNLEDAITAYKRVPAGIPDLHARIGNLAAERDRVYARLTVTGTNTGRFFGVPPTGRPFALFAVIVVSTALFQAPQHRALSGGLDRGAYEILLRTNWIRTAAWSAYGLLGLWMVLQTASWWRSRRRSSRGAPIPAREAGAPFARCAPLARFGRVMRPCFTAKPVPRLLPPKVQDVFASSDNVILSVSPPSWPLCVTGFMS